jgi:hypothetical protein
MNMHVNESRKDPAIACQKGLIGSLSWNFPREIDSCYFPFFNEKISR